MSQKIFLLLFFLQPMLSCSLSRSLFTQGLYTCKACLDTSQIYCQDYNEGDDYYFIDQEGYCGYQKDFQTVGYDTCSNTFVDYYGEIYEFMQYFACPYDIQECKLASPVINVPTDGTSQEFEIIALSKVSVCVYQFNYTLNHNEELQVWISGASNVTVYIADGFEKHPLLIENYNKSKEYNHRILTDNQKFILQDKYYNSIQYFGTAFLFIVAENKQNIVTVHYGEYKILDNKKIIIFSCVGGFIFLAITILSCWYVRRLYVNKGKTNVRKYVDVEDRLDKFKYN